MTNNNNQPKHTQGEWKVVTKPGINIGKNRAGIFADKVRVIEVGYVSEEDAHRIVTAVNFYDKMMELLKYVDSVHIPNDFYKNEIKQLLKQAEGK